MLLRTRITLMVTLSFAVLSAGLLFAVTVRDKMAEDRYAEAVVTGQQTVWLKIVDSLAQRVEAKAPVFTQAIAALQPEQWDDRNAFGSVAQPLFEQLKADGVSRIEVLAADGAVVYSSTGEVFPAPLLNAGLTSQIVETEKPLWGVQQDANRIYAAAAAVPLRIAGHSAAVVTFAHDIAPALTQFKASTEADCFLIDRSGNMILATNDAVWPEFERQDAAQLRGTAILPVGDRFYAVAALPVKDMSGRLIGKLITSFDTTDRHRHQALVGQLTLALIVAFLGLIILSLYYYLRTSFAPLDEAIEVLNALSKGDTSVNIEGETKEDEIGRIAGTVEVFREGVTALERVRSQRERQRRRQERFILKKMEELADILDQAAKEAVLHDLRQVEQGGAAAIAMPETEGDGKKGKFAGELGLLAIAMQTMAQQIRGQHQRLDTLVEERTRDLETVKEALRQKEQFLALQQEVDFARELQLASLQTVFPPFPDRHEFEIYARMVAAKEVGGDFYDFFFIDREHLGFAIGDASGKGVPAAMFVATCRSLMRAIGAKVATPSECVTQVNDLMCVDNPATMFVTLFYGVLNTRTGEVVYCNAGHNPPYILRKNGVIETTASAGGIAVGVMDGMDYETQTFTLAPGDIFISFTDGVTEATDANIELFTEQRLTDAIAAPTDGTCLMVTDVIYKAIDAFVKDAPQADDITMLVLKNTNGLAQPKAAEAAAGA